MDYEEMYLRMLALERDLKDRLSAAQRCLKSVSGNSERGDLKGLYGDLARIGSLSRECGAITEEYASLTEGFDVSEYMNGGDFAKQMIEYCEKLSVDVKGEYPVYEMFPYKVKIDGENREIIVDRKKTQCARPLHFARTIKQSQEKLNKAAFNVTAFLNELAEAYDTAAAHKERDGKAGKSGQDILLKDLYPYMVPMQRFRREYDMQSYAFDLARLFSSDAETTKDGRGFQFGSSRVASKLIRILDRDGNEQFLGTIRFFERLEF